MDSENKNNITKAVNDQSVFLALDELDNKQISDEVRGVYSDDLVYQMKRRVPDGSGGYREVTVTSLSYAGVKAVIMYMARKGYRIITSLAEFIETPDEFRASCKVTCVFDNGSVEMFGYSRQQKNFSSGAVNEFAFIQSGSKSQRNALRNVIPEKIATEMIKQYLKENKVKTVSRDDYTIKEDDEIDVPDKTLNPKRIRTDGEQREENLHNNHIHQNSGTAKVSERSPPANPQTKLIWKDGKAQGK